MTIDSIVFKEVVIFPELFLGVSIVYLVIYGVFLSVTRTYPLIQTSVLYLSVLILIMVCFLLANENLIVLEINSFNNTFLNDFTSVSSKQLIACSCIACLLMIQFYLINKKVNQYEYILMFLFAILGFFLLCSSNDLITAYLAIELQSLSFYVLAAFKKNSTFSVNAGLKYFILGAFSSSLFLLGSSFIYGFTGTLNFEDLKDLFFWVFPGSTFWLVSDDFVIKQNNFLLFSLENSCDDTFILIENLLPENFWGYKHILLENLEAYQCFVEKNLTVSFFCVEFLENDLLQFAIIFILISLFFKLALAPFHLWAPDIYEGSLSSSAFFFAVMPKLGIFLLLIRLFYCCFYGFIDNWRYYVVSIAVVSVIIGSLVGLEQRKIKNLLAYSSISHMGYSLMAFSIGTFEGIQLLLCYLFIYICSGLCIWSIFLITRLRYSFNKKQNKDLADFVLLNKSNKMLAIYLSAVLLSIAGIPPMVGFLVKIGIFLVSVEASMYFVALITILFSVISTFYYIRIIKVIFFENKLVGKLYYPITTQRSIIIVLLFYLLIFLFVNPTLPFLITYKFSLIFF